MADGVVAKDLYPLDIAIVPSPFPDKLRLGCGGVVDEVVPRKSTQPVQSGAVDMADTWSPPAHLPRLMLVHRQHRRRALLDRRLVESRSVPPVLSGTRFRQIYWHAVIMAGNLFEHRRRTVRAI